jgi:hypothetical protein
MANVPGSKYQEALQDTGRFLKDPDLRGGEPLLDVLGMPKPISGNFASVFTIKGIDGRRWAVKCFTRRVNDQADRYQRISEMLATVKSQWKVGFKYLSEGVLIDGAWQPVLKMEWVDAMGLLPFVEAHLSERQTLVRLAGKFEDLVHDLSSYGIAHGDLQHGNILVTPSEELKLIDYDGMFVPGLESLRASELGQENYQSPLRNTDTWGPDIDRFSSWIIYVSLTALALDPGLWTLLHAAGDETLLFHRDDFIDRDGSRVHYALANSSVPKLQEISKDIDFLWRPDLAAIPLLGTQPASNGASAPGVSWGLPSTGSKVTGTRWLRQVGAPNGLTSADNAADSVSHGGPIGTAAWLTTHIPLPPPVEFSRPSAAVRVVCAALLCFVVLFATIAGFGTTSPTIAGFIDLDIVTLLVIWSISFVSYKLSPVRREMRRNRKTFGERRAAASKANRIVSDLEAAVRKLARTVEASKTEAGKKANKAREEEQRELAVVDKRLEREIAKLDHEMGSLKDKEGTESGNALRVLQQAHVDTHMRMARVSRAKIQGIGPTLVATLTACGITTAADFTGIRYTQNRYGTGGANLVLRNGLQVSPRGIGVKKAQSLNSWRLAVEIRARSSQPKILPKAQLDAISFKYAQQIGSLANDRQSARIRAEVQNNELRAKWTKTRTEIATELSVATERSARLHAEKKSELAAARRGASNSEWQRDFAKRELDRYDRIRYRRYLWRLIIG